MAKETINGTITKITRYKEEGLTVWWLTINKLLWLVIWFVSAVCMYHVFDIVLGRIGAFSAVIVFLLFTRLAIPGSLLLFDELISRLFPTLRSGLRQGTVRVYDFRILADNSSEYACILKGDLVGAMPLEGDKVFLRGRMKCGTFVIQEGKIESTGTIITQRALSFKWILLLDSILLLCLYLIISGVFDEKIIHLGHILLDRYEIL